MCQEKSTYRSAEGNELTLRLDELVPQFGDLFGSRKVFHEVSLSRKVDVVELTLYRIGNLTQFFCKMIADQMNVRIDPPGRSQEEKARILAHLLSLLAQARAEMGVKHADA